jgi:signal transduction histidine kinase
MMNSCTNIDDALCSMDGHEKRRQFIRHAIELVLSFGDFQKEIHCQCTPDTIAAKAVERIGQLISFEASAIFLVDEETSDMRMSVCTPIAMEKEMEADLDFLIRHDYVAWAIRERRGIIIFSENSRRQILLHVLATYSRTRGVFMGLFSDRMRRLPEASLEILSIILRNAANGIESLTYSNMLRQQKEELEKAVAEKTQRLVHYEKQLLQTQNMEAIAALAGGVAHQFNNALTGLIGYLDLAAMSVDAHSEAFRCIENTRPITERMSKLTNHLLAYAQGGKYVVNPITLKNLIMDMLPAIQRSIKSTVQVTTDLEDEAITVKVDLMQMRIAILAIVNNADEAIAAQGRIHLHGYPLASGDLPDAVRSELGPGDYLCLCITDSGKGMDKNTMRRMFQPFFSTKFEGRGLSMAAVFGIIKNHNGWIDVDSRIGEGTTVKIYLPVENVG